MKRKIMCLTLLALGACLTMAGEDADKWLEKMAAVYAKAPLSADYTADMDIEQMGMKMHSKMSGKIIFKDTKHQRMELNVEMDMGGRKMNMTMNTINDGKTMWIDTSMPMGRQVSKMDLDQADQMMKDAGFGSMAGGGLSMDKIVESMKESMDVTVESVKDGKVTLSATYKEVNIEASNPMAGAMSERQNTRMVMVLDEKNIFPLQMSMFIPKDAEKAGIVMNMTNLKYLKESDIPEGTFSFSPPEGVPVIDIGAQMKKATQNQHQGHQH